MRVSWTILITYFPILPRGYPTFQDAFPMAGVYIVGRHVAKSIAETGKLQNAGNGHGETRPGEKPFALAQRGVY